MQSMPKTIEQRDIDLPADYEDRFGTIRLEFRRLEHQVGADHIEIHIFQPGGQEKHRYSDFKITDENAREVAFVRSNQNHPEPYNVALLGLNLAGWSCPKWGNRNHSEAETLTERIETASALVNIALNIAADYPESSLERTTARALALNGIILGGLLEHEDAEGERVEETLAQFDSIADGQNAIDVSLPEYVPEDIAVGAEKLMRRRLQRVADDE